MIIISKIVVSYYIEVLTVSGSNDMTDHVLLSSISGDEITSRSNNHTETKFLLLTRIRSIYSTTESNQIFGGFPGS